MTGDYKPQLVNQRRRTAQNGIMGRRGRQGNTTPQRTNNSTEDLMENEGNEYIVVDPSRMMISLMSSMRPIKKSSNRSS
jgi:hypothetical protein